MIKVKMIKMKIVLKSNNNNKNKRENLKKYLKNPRNKNEFIFVF